MVISESTIGIGIIVVAFLASAILTKNWIRAATKSDLVGRDMNKPGKPAVAESGGIAVMAAFAFAVLAYVFLKTYILQSQANLIEALALLSAVLLATFIGFVDDLIGWKIGLSQWKKPLMTIPIALPLAVIAAGTSVIQVPLFGLINFGILYPLLLVPIGIVGAANAFNLLAGYNGLEAGMGTIILSTLGIIAFKTGLLWIALICWAAVAALLGFLLFNWYPAKVFPGDSLTYPIGALVAIVAILGNMERAAVLLFAPYFLDFILPLRKRLKVEAFANPRTDGSLEMAYGQGLRGVYDVTHLAHLIVSKIKKKVYEVDIVALILIAEAMLAAFVLLTF